MNATALKIEPHIGQELGQLNKTRIDDIDMHSKDSLNSYEGLERNKKLLTDKEKNDIHEYSEPLVDENGEALFLQIAANDNTEPSSEAKPEVKKAKPFVHDGVWQVLYGIASGFHGLAAVGGLFNIFPKSFRDFIGKQSTNFSKIVNLANYSDKGQVSYRENNALDSISKFLFPAVVSWVPVNDMFLAAGISSGTTMMHIANNPRIKNKKTFLGNLAEHFKHYKDLFQEVVKNPINLKDIKEFFNDPSKAIENLSEHRIAHVGGNMNFFGGIGGLLADGKHPFIKTAFSVVRNLGGIISDLAKILHKDPNLKIAGVLYVFAHVLDVFQTAIARSNEGLSKTISHIVQFLNAPANYFYTKTSETLADNTFEDREFKPKQA